MLRQHNNKESITKTNEDFCVFDIKKSSTYLKKKKGSIVYSELIID